MAIFELFGSVFILQIKYSRIYSIIGKNSACFLCRCIPLDNNQLLGWGRLEQVLNTCFFKQISQGICRNHFKHDKRSQGSDPSLNSRLRHENENSQGYFKGYERIFKGYERIFKGYERILKNDFSDHLFNALALECIHPSTS